MATSCGNHRRANYHSNPEIVFPKTGTPTGTSSQNGAQIVREKRFAMEAVGDESMSCSTDNNFKRCFRVINKWIGGKPFNDLSRSNRLATIPVWGPTWKISFKLFVRTEPTEWANVLRFTSTGNDCCNLGDRIPFVTIEKNELIILNAVNGETNNQHRFNYPLNKLFLVELAQLEVDGKV